MAQLSCILQWVEYKKKLTNTLIVIQLYQIIKMN